LKVTDDIAALVGSRICHDLISPLGAIGNGLELLGLSGVPSTPEMALITESVESANARIRFFRVAYGPAEPGQMMGRAEIASILSAASRGGRLSYFWETSGDQPRREIRAIFLYLQCCEAALPIGGEIRIRRIPTGWEIEAEADRLLVDETLWNGLQSSRTLPVVSAAQVQFALLPAALSDLNKQLALKIDTNRIIARF
jgi:histidine phosphotransferase ChpT